MCILDGRMHTAVIEISLVDGMRGRSDHVVCTGFTKHF